MFQYHRTAMYYETDAMGVIHHAHYIHWMEEARVAWMDDFGYGFKRLTELGILSPIMQIEIRYMKPTRFMDDVTVGVSLRSYDGVRIVLDYRMCVGEDVVCEASSSHVFTSAETGAVLRMRRACPELDVTLKQMAEAQA